MAVRAVSPFQFEFLERVEMQREEILHDINLIDDLQINFKDLVDKR